MLFKIGALAFEWILLDLKMAQVLVLPKIDFKFWDELTAVYGEAQGLQLRKVTYIPKNLLHFAFQCLIVGAVQDVIELLKLIALRVSERLDAAHGGGVIAHGLDIIQTLH